MTYEIHITVNQKDREGVQACAEKHGWKTSEIARDIILGNNTYFYLTCHCKTKAEAFEKLGEASYYLIVNYQIAIVRQKIELIIYDTKMKE
jgi:hypothetical protein